MHFINVQRDGEIILSVARDVIFAFFQPIRVMPRVVAVPYHRCGLAERLRIKGIRVGFVMLFRRGKDFEFIFVSVVYAVGCDSVMALRELDFAPDVVLLDPMFPQRQKSSLVKKKFQLLHSLESPCANEEELLDAARAAGPKKIVIKRPAKGAFLAGIKPDYSLEGKKIRYDCICLK